MIDVNITLGIQCINFIISIFFINYLIVSPIRTNMRTRALEMQELHSEVNMLSEKAEKMLATYTHALEEARDNAVSLKKNAQIEAIKQAEVSIIEARMQAREHALAFEKKLFALYTTVCDEVAQKVDEFSTTILKRLV